MTFQEFKRAVKLRYGCVNCGFDLSPYALDFHHINGKDEKISPGNVGTIDKLIEECLKYDIVVLCANCHRMIHHGEFSERQIKRIKERKIIINPELSRCTRLFEESFISEIMLDRSIDYISATGKLPKWGS
jgi:hypothetical protein